MITDLVSTIIPVFNRPEMLRQAVDSVLNQTYRPIEIIIVDDGSVDDTAAVAKALVESYPDTVRYVHQDNAGPGPARDNGREHAQGEFIQYLDSDDRLLPNKFSDQVKSLRENPECDIAYGVTRLMDQNGKVISDPYKWTDQNHSELYPKLLVDRWWCTHTPLYRRSLTDRIGAWCDMRWSQDWEYDSRIGGLKTKIVSCGTHVSEHVHHDGVRQTSAADWTTDPTRLRNRVRLLTVLWEGASAAGVSASAPERQHFARWCFSIARQCAAQKLSQETKKCLELADTAAGPNGTGRKGIKTFRLMMTCFGGAGASKFADLLQSIRRTVTGGSKTGDATLSQSFADQIKT